MKEIAYSSCGVVFYMTGPFPCDWHRRYEEGVREGLAGGTDLHSIRASTVRNRGFT